jgi:hypothetical protein
LLPGYALACPEAHKVVGPLSVPSGTETNCTEGAGIRGVGNVRILMGLNVAPKRELAMLRIIELHAGHDIARADGARHSSLRGESVKPDGDMGD